MPRTDCDRTIHDYMFSMQLIQLSTLSTPIFILERGSFSEMKHLSKQPCMAKRGRAGQDTNTKKLTSLRGMRTARARGLVSSRCLRIWWYKLCRWTAFSLRVIPSSWQSVLMPSGDIPRRRMPARVGNRGSSQPRTYFSDTSTCRHNMLWELSSGNACAPALLSSN